MGSRYGVKKRRRPAVCRPPWLTTRRVGLVSGLGPPSGCDGSGLAGLQFAGGQPPTQEQTGAADDSPQQQRGRFGNRVAAAASVAGQNLQLELAFDRAARGKEVDERLRVGQQDAELAA